MAQAQQKTYLCGFVEWSGVSVVPVEKLGQTGQSCFIYGFTKFRVQGGLDYAHGVLIAGGGPKVRVERTPPFAVGGFLVFGRCVRFGFDDAKVSASASKSFLLSNVGLHSCCGFPLVRSRGALMLFFTFMLNLVNININMC